MELHTINLEYVPSAADIRRCAMRVAFCSCRVAFAVAALCLLVISECWYDVGLGWNAELICSLAIPIVPIAILVVRVVRAWEGASRLDLIGQKIAADREGFTILAAGSNEFILWKDVSSITEHHGDIFLWQSEGNGHFVARSAFINANASTDFLQTTKMLRAQSRMAPAMATARLY